MMINFITILRKLSPFITVLVLWRLRIDFWNPAGILAIIPIFFCSFVKQTKYFPCFAIIFCFLIDYNCDTKLFWTTMYCIAYAINGFQTFTDLSRLDNNALNAFMVFFGISLILLSIFNLNWTVFGRMIWMFLWCCICYVPITKLIQKVIK